MFVSRDVKFYEDVFPFSKNCKDKFNFFSDQSDEIGFIDLVDVPLVVDPIDYVSDVSIGAETYADHFFVSPDNITQKNESSQEIINQSNNNNNIMLRKFTRNIKTQFGTRIMC